MTLILIPFAIFFCCCAAQIILVRRVRQALSSRHPDVWLKVSTTAWSIDGAVFKFARKRRDRDLHDPILTKRTIQLQQVYWTALAAWLVMVALLVTGRH